MEMNNNSSSPKSCIKVENMRALNLARPAPRALQSSQRRVRISTSRCTGDVPHEPVSDTRALRGKGERVLYGKQFAAWAWTDALWLHSAIDKRTASLSLGDLEAIAPALGQCVEAQNLLVTENVTNRHDANKSVPVGPSFSGPAELDVRASA